jgi:hypothetical protein
MLVPLYGFLKGDTIGLLVLVHDTELVREIGRKLQEAASVRVAPRPGAEVYCRGSLLSPDLTVGEVGLKALERVDVIPKEQ